MALQRKQPPQNHLEWWDHLTWLEDRQPRKLLALLEQDGLKAHLDASLQEVLRAQANAVKAGMSQREALDLAYREVVAPEQPEPPEKDPLRPTQRARLASLLQTFRQKYDPAAAATTA